MGRAFEFRKGRKMKRWAAMSKAFTRLGKDIVMAVKEGGPDPESNAKLRAVIQNCKAVNMPKDNVERAIKRASNKDQGDYAEIVYEGYAPHGIAILIETATDNHVRTVANLRSHFSKCNGTLGTSGSVEFMFDHTCFFKLEKGDNDLEELELELIDFGADEIFEEEDGILIYAAFSDFGNLQKAIEEKGLELINSGFDRIPMDIKSLSEEEEADVDKLLERLEEDDDVQNVFHNMG
ncbi:YebC/PmpR family DNA-binding transcriptional regulator [Cryomorpha ignava]|uniref:Probable transcriptional regulatory protein G3O08_09715 n=1 Tax=Cryomorpha ignava TaxID=101383 RepID=A0A7K3WQ45_9FLAO|nr:YebC/PmpR family DNA-binding transcriptional regulator [Cryomorpha ignava]NEN23777.1 YebC/PmpR family DNA-binding transcriptional regulator [Cryomorpha ignava]